MTSIALLLLALYLYAGWSHAEMAATSEVFRADPRGKRTAIFLILVLFWGLILPWVPLWHNRKYPAKDEQ